MEQKAVRWALREDPGRKSSVDRTLPRKGVCVGGTYHGQAARGNEGACLLVPTGSLARRRRTFPGLPFDSRIGLVERDGGRCAAPTTGKLPVATRVRVLPYLRAALPVGDGRFLGCRPTRGSVLLGRVEELVKSANQSLASLQDVDIDGHGPDGPARDFEPVEFHKVLTRAKDTGCVGKRVEPLFQGQDILAAKMMVIGKNSPTDQVASERFERMPKTGRVTYGAECRCRLVPQGFEWLARVFGVDQCSRSMGKQRLIGVGCPPVQLGGKLFEPFRGHGIGAGDGHHVGSRQLAERFTQQAAWQYVSVAPGLESVDEDEVEIAVDASMLKTIIQHDQLSLMVFDGLARGLDTIRILQVNDLGQLTSQLECLVVDGPFGCAIAATHQRHANTLLSKPVGQPSHERSLSGSTGRDISDAHHGHSYSTNRSPAKTIESISELDDPAIGDSGESQGASQDGRFPSAPLPA